MSGRRAVYIVCVVSALFCAARARAAVIIMTPEIRHDLTNGGSVTINNADFVTVDQQSTGSGVIHSFVRIGAANQGVVEGYNTDGRPLQFDEKESATFTRSQRLDELQVVTRNNVQYYKFLLDINQESKAPLLTLNEVEVYLGNAPDLLSYSPNRSGGGTGFGPNSTFVYDLDQGTDNAIDLNYNLNSGSGSGDMWVYIPKANFDAAHAGNQNDFVYLYSKFGVPNANNDGYEEWSAITGPTNNVPEPSSLLALFLCTVFLVMLRRRPITRLCIASSR